MSEMSEVFVIKNQDNRLLGKADKWVSGFDQSKIFQSEHKDIALNTLIEENSHDVMQRLDLLSIKLDEDGSLILPDDIDMTPPPPKPEFGKKSDETETDIAENAQATA